MDDLSCTKCDAPIGAAAKFCPRCGAGIAADAVVRSATRVTPLLRKWRRLTREFTRVDIRQSLGEPLSIAYPESEGGGARIEEWTYVYETQVAALAPLQGVIRFCVDDARVLSWNEPNWADLGDRLPQSEAGPA